MEKPRTLDQTLSSRQKDVLTTLDKWYDNVRYARTHLQNPFRMTQYQVEGRPAYRSELERFGRIGMNEALADLVDLALTPVELALIVTEISIKVARGSLRLK